jgi:hypothetical protein
MQENPNESLNSKRNRGFDWMLDNQKSNNNQEEHFFNFNLQKSVSLFSRRFQFSVSLTGTKSKEKTDVLNSDFH